MNNSLPIQMTKTKKEIIDVINKSNLPACVLYEIFINITNEIGSNVQIELKQEQEKENENKKAALNKTEKE